VATARALLSCGLDSTRAIKVVMDRGIKVTAINHRACRMRQSFSLYDYLALVNSS
jgi:adenylyl- and sulfurtransferase ThiI